MLEKHTERLKELEAAMAAPDFWSNKESAQSIIREYEEVKALAAGGGKYDASNAIVTIFGGAGGVDAEDFAYMLTHMYFKYIERCGWVYDILHEHMNDHGGYKNMTFEVLGKGSYGELKHESGVHRLVRISPFNAKKQRHTAFAMVEVVPKLGKLSDIDISESDLEVHFTRSGGPGGQNVNKRDTAVRMTHTPTGLSVHVSSERSQVQNKERALELLMGKLHHKQEEDRKKEARGLSVAATTDVEWGSQIRSYVLHPYKMVKDHRTGVEVRAIEKVLEDGELEPFIEAAKELS